MATYPFDVNDAQVRGAFLRHGMLEALTALRDHTPALWGRMTARQMVERVPAGQLPALWSMIRDDHEPIGELLGEIDLPLLLAKHEGCLMFTDPGFDDICAAFPSASTVAVDGAPSADEGFAGALREFCAG